MRSLTFLSVLLFFTATSIGQTRVVHGMLTAFNKYPVANVEVVAKKSKTSVMTDSAGNFSIVCKEKDQIKIKPETFKTVSRKIDKNTDTLQINLVFMDSKKNRETAIGYGYIMKDDLTFATEHLQQENNDFCSYTNVYELIQGKFPGVTVDRTSGTYKIYIRGMQSINAANEVLFVVDGSPTSTIGGMFPCNIGSINVIKDGMSSIYGTRGANGVILIETKRAN